MRLPVVAMIRLTLDTNCLIDVEQRRSGYESVLGLLGLHKEGKIDLGVVATSANDIRLLGDSRVSNFQEFEKWLGSLGFFGVTLLKPSCRWDISFWDWCVGSNSESNTLEDKIQSILFKNLAAQTIRGELNPRWLDQMNDVFIMWAHIWNKRDIFVTRDGNFLKQTKRRALVELGAGEFLLPADACRALVSPSLLN